MPVEVFVVPILTVSSSLLILPFISLTFLSLTMGKEHRLSVLENRVPRKMFGPKRDALTGVVEKRT